MKKHSVVGLGGSFDHFHAGHQHFLRYASELGRVLVIGITSDRLTRQKKYVESMEPFATRWHAVKSFCRQQGIQAKLVELTDVFGPTLEDSDVRVLCVTPETTAGADKINEVRGKLSMRPLPVYICDFLHAEDGAELHAVRIRRGEANRQGKIYARVFNQELTLTDEQRAALSQPAGELTTNENIGDLLRQTTNRYVVGDQSLASFLANHWKFQIGVFDGKTKRQPANELELDPNTPILTAINPAGVITESLVTTLEAALSRYPQKTYVNVTGEEDLATTALILLAPLGAQIFYGAPAHGMMCLTVTEQLKDEIYTLFHE